MENILAPSTQHRSLQTYPVTRFQLNPGVAIDQRSGRDGVAPSHWQGAGVAVVAVQQSSSSSS